MSRSSYSKPSVPNQGSPGPVHTSTPDTSSNTNKARPQFSTPGVSQELDSDDGLYTPGTPGSGQSGAGTGGRSDRGRNTPKPA